jgi:ABC-type lipoprotein release transport system permease subunit
MLVQTSATDVRVLAGVCLTLVVVAIATCLAPARRAARIEPADVLRTGR